MSRYDEAGSSNSDSGFRNGVNRSLDRHSLSVKRATDSTRGTTPAIGNFHRIHPFFRVPSFNFSFFFLQMTMTGRMKTMGESLKKMK